jgi:hypothetical protein
LVEPLNTPPQQPTTLTEPSKPVTNTIQTVPSVSASQSNGTERSLTSSLLVVVPLKVLVTVPVIVLVTVPVIVLATVPVMVLAMALVINQKKRIQQSQHLQNHQQIITLD